MRKPGRALIAAVLCGALTTLPAGAGNGLRAYAFTKGSGYASSGHELVVPTVTIVQGTELVFANLHLWGHSITSDDWASPDVRLFRSDVIPFGKSSVVRGVDSLAHGTYGFFCSNHMGMRGTLVVE